MTAMAAGQSGAEEGQGTVRPTICAAGAPAPDMACRVDPCTSVLEGSNVLAHWATDICMAVGGDGDNKVGEAEVALDTITGSKGSSGTIASAWGGWR
jgi:hypothetical protein